MTVITKPISEKKADKLDQPLVVAECLPNQDVETGDDGRNSLPPQDPRYLILRARARRASSITTACLLMMALLVMCCGILGGFYLYKQFAHSQEEIAKQKKAEEISKMHRLRGWCRIPYEQSAALYADEYKSPSEFQDLQFKADTKFLNEEMDIDDNSERISVPNFDGGRSSQFVHDFNANKTGIIDVDGHRCFVMPLNRSEVMPPHDLMDLVHKMWAGYYKVDTQTVRKNMRVVIPPITDPTSVGFYILKECANFPIYKLEEYVSGVFKRSVPEEPAELFSHFAGKIYENIMLVNEEEVKAYERGQSQL